MTTEELAKRVGANKKSLHDSLKAAKSVLVTELKKHFRPGRFDFDQKRLVSDCGNYALVWRLRLRPDQPVSYENQQTNVGVVVCQRLNPNTD